jgi:hypothetical protein
MEKNRVTKTFIMNAKKKLEKKDPETENVKSIFLKIFLEN